MRLLLSSRDAPRFLHVLAKRQVRGPNIATRLNIHPAAIAVPRRLFSSSKDNRLHNELLFFALRVVIRVMGQATSYLWRTGYYKHAIGVIFATPVVTLIGLGAIYGERVPYSNRFHIVTLSRGAEAKLAKTAREQILKQEKDNLLAESEELFKKTKEICDNILQICHEDGLVAPTMSFKVHVVKSNVANAFVLPDGSIFVYTGLIPIAFDEGSLAAVLGHEISHALARHSAEKIGTLRLCLLAYEFIRGLFDHRSEFSQMIISFLAGTLVQVGIPLYHSRKMESEADRIGLIIAAKAGYDPRLAAELWKRMSEKDHKHDKQETKEKRSNSKVIMRLPEPTDDDYKNNLMLKGSAPLVAQDPSTSSKPPTRPVHSASTPPSPSSSRAGVSESATQLSASGSSSLSHANHLSMGSRMSELLSTHPCHERRIEELSEYSLTLVPTYIDAIERINSEGRFPPDSRRVLLPEMAKKGINDMSDDTDFDYDYDENSLVSVRLAQKASALLVGPEEERIMNFLKAINRDRKGWGDT
jgi:Zn-dependent protease with chaperone function